jgi:hypothetical protein
MIGKAQTVTYLKDMVVGWGLVYVHIFGLHFGISAETFAL